MGIMLSTIIRNSTPHPPNKKKTHTAGRMVQDYFNLLTKFKLIYTYK